MAWSRARGNCKGVANSESRSSSPRSHRDTREKTVFLDGDRLCFSFAREATLFKWSLCDPCVSVVKIVGELFRRHIRDLERRILVVPLLRDGLKRKAEGLALAWREGGDAQIDGFGIGAAGSQDAQGYSFALGQLAQGILERYVDDDVSDGLIAGVRDRAIDIGDGGADEVLRSAHLQVRELDAGSVGRWAGGSLLLAPRDQKKNRNDGHDHGDADSDGPPVRFAFFDRWIRLNESAHGGIVLSVTQRESAYAKVGRKTSFHHRGTETQRINQVFHLERSAALAERSRKTRVCVDLM